MFDHLVSQLTKGTPKTSEVWLESAPNKKSATVRSVAIKMRNVESGEIFLFQSLAAAGRYFRISDLRIIKGLVDNPERIWRGHQAKPLKDKTDWVTPIQNNESVSKVVKGVNHTYYLITWKDTGEEQVCIGYEQAASITGVTRSYLSKLVCYGDKPNKLNFSIRKASQEDVLRYESGPVTD